MRVRTAEVSGRAFLGLTGFIKGLAQSGLLEAIIEEGGKATQQTFSERIRIAAWYPYAAYVAFLCAIDRKLGKGDNEFGRELGMAAGKRDIETTLRVYRALSDPERLIRACTKVWESYHRNAGRMKAIDWQPENTVVQITDFSQMHPVHCRLMEGWMSGSMEAIGCRMVSMVERACMNRGDPCHEFVCRWSPGT